MHVGLIDSIILGFVLAAAYASIGHLRGLGWIAAIALNFFVTTNYWRTGFGEPILFAGLCDAAICLAVFFFARYLWELVLWALMLTSVFVNLLMMFDVVSGANVLAHDIYASALEIITVLSLLLIMGMSGFVRHDRINWVAFHPWRYFLGLVRPTPFADR